MNQTVHVSAPDSCPHCKSDKLTPIQEFKEHIQEDIVLKPRTVVTRYLHKQAYCAHCSRPVIKAADNELLNAHIGPVAKSTAIYLRYRLGLPYRKVQELFKDLFNLEFVPASALGFDRKAALKGEAIYEDLREKIRASSVVQCLQDFDRKHCQDPCGEPAFNYTCTFADAHAYCFIACASDSNMKPDFGFPLF